MARDSSNISCRLLVGTSCRREDAAADVVSCLAVSVRLRPSAVRVVLPRLAPVPYSLDMAGRPPLPRSRPRDRAWVEVCTAALRRNLGRIGEAAGPDIRLIPMVKANGYGLGVERVVKALRPARPFGWGVATIEEGLELKRLGLRAPLMICAPVPPAALPLAVRAGLIPSISDLAALAALRDLAHHAPAHSAAIPFQIEVDTGMGRAGFSLGGTPPGPPGPLRSRRSPQSPTPTPSASPWLPHLRRATQSGLRLYGIFTHLHSADQPDLASARGQIAPFDHFISGLQRAGDLPPDTLVHCANSAGALRLASRTANAARPGVYLYGVSAGDARRPPESVVAVRARVLLVRDVPSGTTLGYGATYAARSRERWAAVGIGYGDGLPRALSNRGSAIANGRRVPIIGRISMDTTVVRISSNPAHVRSHTPGPLASHAGHNPRDPTGNAPAALTPGDVVTFVGRDGGIELSLEEVAELAGTIPYEILTGLSRRLPRVSV